MYLPSAENEDRSFNVSDHSFQSFDWMANDQNLKHITLANTDLIEQIQTDEEDEFFDNPDYLSGIGGESPGFGKRGGNAYNVMSSKRK